jgi:predicted RNA-binding protein with RPS1 domain
MTDKERPVEERNELLDDLVNAATAVADTDESKQKPAVVEQPESVVQPDAASAAEATQAEDVSATAEQSADAPTAPADTPAEAEAAPAAAELSADAPTAPADAPAEAEAAVPAAAAPADAPAEAEVAADLTAAATAEQSADAPTALADAPAEAEAAPAAAELSADAPTAPADAPAEAEAAPAAAELSAAPTEAEGASYTPVAEDESGKPRRVKDLEPGMELEGRVTSIALYGIFVDLGVGRDGLVHISEMSDTRIDSPSDIVQIGDTVKVRVKSVEPDGRRISLTMRSKERANQPRERGRGKKPELNREALAALRVGDNVEGTVTGIAPFGVFVDIGVGKDGLVHVSELAEGRIDKAEDAVTVGQTYTFKILEVDAEGTRISLSLRRAQRGQRLQQLEKGQILEGTVSGMAPFGAFVDIGVGRDGLVHISELADSRVAKVEDAVKVGDKVTVRVLEIDPSSKRISLSLRLEDRPREAPTPSEPREERGPRREDRGRREERSPRREREEAPRAPETYSSTEEPEEAFNGDATIEDLLSKFGSANKRDRKRRQDDDEDTESDDRYSRRQRDAIRRTLQQLSDDE